MHNKPVKTFDSYKVPRSNFIVRYVTGTRKIFTGLSTKASAGYRSYADSCNYHLINYPSILVVKPHRLNGQMYSSSWSRCPQVHGKAIPHFTKERITLSRGQRETSGQLASEPLFSQFTLFTSDNEYCRQHVTAWITFFMPVMLPVCVNNCRITMKRFLTIRK